MSDPWVAEREVSPELARELIESQFTGLAVTELELIGAGWDNSAYLVNDEWVFRFPRRQLAVALMETECKVLPGIAELVPLAIPDPQFIGRPTAAFPWPFAGYRRIVGCTACVANLTDEERTRAAVPLAEFLAALHATRNPARLGAPVDPLGRFDLEKRTRFIEERLAEARTAGVIGDTDDLMKVVEEVPSDWTPSNTTLVHGDLYVRHVVIDDSRAVNGVIDWGDVHIGERAGDLSLACTLLPPSAHGAFRDAYGEIDDETWCMARYRALHYGATITIYGHKIGDADLLREGLRMLEHVRGS